MSQAFDLVVIGAGVGGYPAAIRASQLGFSVAIIEKEKTLGGTCLNVGCIPSKALLESSELYAQAQHSFEKHGIKIQGVSVDLDAMLKRKEGIVRQLTGGVEFLMRKNKITVFKGTGRVTAPKQVEVGAQDGTKTLLEAKHILIATGSVPISLRGIDFDGNSIVSSSEALEFKEVPKHLVVIGAGVIGLELGSVWARLGARVTVVEYLPNILPGTDMEVVTAAQKIFTEQGIDFVLGAKVQSATAKKRGVDVAFEKDGQTQTIQADKVLLSVGRKPYTDGLGLDEAGVKRDDKGRVVVDKHFQSSVPGIYAIGDVIAGPMLAHKAEDEGMAVAEIMATGHGHVTYEAIPGVIYTHPEIASVGKTEEQLKAEGIAYNKGSFPYQPNGRAKALGEQQGFCKILADAKTDRILGAHIIGARAGDLIAELAVAIEFSASAEDIARSTHAHPTLSEIVKEAALATIGRPLSK